MPEDSTPQPQPRPSDSQLERALVNIRVARQILSISTRLVADLVATGELPHVRIRRRLLFRPEALRAWAAEREIGGGQ